MYGCDSSSLTLAWGVYRVLSSNMTTQLLATELANLIQESKRKHNDLRQVRVRVSSHLAHTHRGHQAAEKSLDELKQLGNISEQAVPTGTGLGSLEFPVSHG